MYYSVFACICYNSFTSGSLKLVEGSTLMVDWFYTGTGTPIDPAPPTVMTPIKGEFILESIIPPTDDLSQHFQLSGLDFKSVYYPDRYWGHMGTGQYYFTDPSYRPIIQQKNIPHREIF